jgi:PUA-domain protein
MAYKHRRHFLKTKEAKSLLRRASERLGMDLEQTFKDNASVEIVEADFAEIILVNNRPLMIKTGETLTPTLVFKEYFDHAPKVVVDMGAIPYVCKGANVMAPGIRRFEGEFGKGNFVFVVDEKYGKPVAIGEIIYDVNEARMVKQGVVVKNVHFVGDKAWSLIKKLSTEA